jgi:hypothetical protein
MFGSHEIRSLVESDLFRHPTKLEYLQAKKTCDIIIPALMAAVWVSAVSET